MSRRKEKQRQRRRRRKEKRPGVARRTERAAPALGPIDLAVRHPELAHPPVHVDASGVRIPEPLACLGLDPRTPATPASVQAAFRAALAAAPPERDPERARALLQARDLLLDPRHVLARTLGDLRVPRPEHFVPGHEPGQAPERRARATTPAWSSRARLVAIMTLYALLEDELEDGGGRGPQTGLLF